MRLVAIVVILCALGQIANWSPFGVGAMVRSGLSVIGIVGAILLLCERRLAWAFLLPWAALQIRVWITDPSGAWFYQSLMLGATSLSTTSMNNLVVSQKGSGYNLAGVIWLVAFISMILFKMFPRLKPMPKPDWMSRTIQLAFLSVLILLSGMWYVHHQWVLSQASLVVTTDIPWTKVYYKDKLLGRTPLVITPQRITEWGLPLKSDAPLGTFFSSWTQRPMLYELNDRHKYILLDFQGPSFASLDRELPTPWGTRHVALCGGEEGLYQSFTLWNTDHLVTPWLQITLPNSGPYIPGESVQVHCKLTNPEQKHYRGAKPVLNVKLFPFEHSHTSTEPEKPKYHNFLFPMEESWASWPPKSSQSITVTINMPQEPGHYTLMGTFDLLTSISHNRLVFSSPHSNYHLIEIIQPESNPPMTDDDRK